mmetsp:Transcript_14194/g.31534  ORF Transcript_14194/g.31534 Transcript_14194/m.31534 type:complete len:352 (+) Transcript_14194:545-1600(+)
MLRSLRSSSGEKRERVDCWKETVTELSTALASAVTSRVAQSTCCWERIRSGQPSLCKGSTLCCESACDVGRNMPAPGAARESTADGLHKRAAGVWSNTEATAPPDPAWPPAPLFPSPRGSQSAVTGATKFRSTEFRSISMHCRSSSSSSLQSNVRGGNDALAEGSGTALAEHDDIVAGVAGLAGCPVFVSPTAPELLVKWPDTDPVQSGPAACFPPCLIPSSAAANACMGPDGRFPGTVPKVAGNRRLPTETPSSGCTPSMYVRAGARDPCAAKGDAPKTRGVLLWHASAPAAGGQLCDCRRSGPALSSLEDLRIQGPPGVDFARCGISSPAKASCSKSLAEATGADDGKS